MHFERTLFRKSQKCQRRDKPTDQNKHRRLVLHNDRFMIKVWSLFSTNFYFHFFFVLCFLSVITPDYSFNSSSNWNWNLLICTRIKFDLACHRQNIFVFFFVFLIQIIKYCLWQMFIWLAITVVWIFSCGIFDLPDTWIFTLPL